MNGDYNTYGNISSPEDTTSVWVGNNPAAVSMESLVDQFGNLRFGNQVIPLTTPVAPFLNQTPSLPNLSASSFPNLNTVQLPLNSPFLTSQQTGQYYVVNLPQAPPSSISPSTLNSVPPQTYVHQVPSPTSPGSSDGFNVNPPRHFPTQSPNLYIPTSNSVPPQTYVHQVPSPTSPGSSDGFNVNPLRHVPNQSSNPYVPTSNSIPPQTYVHQVPSPTSPGSSDVFNVNSPRHVPTQSSNPYVPTSTQMTNPSELYGVHNLRHVQTHKNYNENQSNGVIRPTQLSNGANAQPTQVSSPETPQAVYQRQRQSHDQESLFRGQPYMKQLSIDSSNGEVIRSPERSVPPLVSSPPFITQLPVGDNYVNERENGTSTSSMTSSASVSPYNSVPSSPRIDPLASLPGHEADNKVAYDPVPPRYTKPTAKTRCLVCDKTVYAMEKRGPIKDDVLFHKGCFRCAVCNMMLDLKNFCQNPNDIADLNIYCKSHKPSEKFGKLDAGALSITRALHAPRLGQMNEQIRGGPEAMKGGKMDAGALNIRSALNVPKAQVTSNETIKNTAHSYQIDNQSVSMVHARSVPATELQVSNKLRTQVWSRANRKAEGVPPPDVIRHDTHISDYSEAPYNHDPPS